MDQKKAYVLSPRESLLFHLPVLRKSYPSLVNGKPEEHFLTILHVRSKDAGTIAEALQSILQQKQLDLRKLIGQGYDGAATFAGKIVKFISIQISSAHEIYIQFLSQITARFSEGDQEFFLTMTSVWKLSYYSSQKAEALKGIQAVLVFPELRS